MNHQSQLLLVLPEATYYSLYSWQTRLPSPSHTDQGFREIMTYELYLPIQ